MRRARGYIYTILIFTVFLVYGSVTINAASFPTVTGLKAEGYNYKSIKVTWNSVPGANGYEIYRYVGWDLYEFSYFDGYPYEGQEEEAFWTNKLIGEVDGNITEYLDTDIKANSEDPYYYSIVAKYSDGNSEACLPAAARVVDTISSNAPTETGCPILRSVDYITPKCYAPGELQVTLTVDDESGIKTILLTFKGNVPFMKNVDVSPGRQKVSLSIPISSSFGEGSLPLTLIALEDRQGNVSLYSTRSSLPDYATIIEKEFEIEFTGSLSNNNSITQLEQMEEGKTVVLKLDSSSKGILKKEYLETIKGKDKTLIVYVDEAGSMQWVFYGKSITGVPKDLDLNVSLESVSGVDYGVDDNILKVDYADNGILPGTVNFRLKSTYVKAMYENTNQMFLYYDNDSNLSLESTTCKVISDAEDKAWCYFDLSHNSSYYLSGSKLKEKPTHVYNEWKVSKTATCKEEGMMERSCKGCGFKETKSIAKITTHTWGEWKIVKNANALESGSQERTCSVCGIKETTTIPKLTPVLTVGKKSIKLAKTKTASLKVKFTVGDTVCVKTSNKKIATATYKNGKLTIKAQKKAGTANITVTTKTGKKAVIKVTVSKAKTSKITCKAVSVKKGKKVTLKPKVTPTYSDDKITYKSANKKIATVTAKGVVKGIKKGKTTITIKSGKKSVKVKVTVK